MPSRIDTSKIDTTFPVPGVNNPTQTFRDNWTAIVNNLSIAQSELTDLINKAVVTAPLTDGANVVVNNLNSSPITGGVYSNQSFGIVDHGTLTETATENVDFSLGAVHTMILAGAAITTVNPINFPGVGYAEIQLHVTVSNISHSLGFGGLALTGPIPVGIDGASKLVFPTPGDYFITLGSDDGTNWIVKMTSTAKARAYTPASSLGADGDTIGQIAYDSNYIYVCSATYDGITNIWKRCSITSW